MENDTNNPPRMLIKLDIEKAYDTLNWSAILAIFIQNEFPSNLDFLDSDLFDFELFLFNH